MSVPGRLHHLTSSLQAAAGTAAQPPRGPSLTTTTFMLNDDETHLNHASYGTVPRMVLQKQFELMMQTEANPVNSEPQPEQRAAGRSLSQHAAEPRAGCPIDPRCCR
jgi:hypothetical protein